MPAFTDNVVIITGASEGIGRALALALAPQGPKLVLSARSRERLESLADECRSLGAEAIAVATDVTDEGQCQELIRRTVEAFGRIDTLVANAGATMWTRLDELEQPGVLEQVRALDRGRSVEDIQDEHMKKLKKSVDASDGSDTRGN